MSPHASALKTPVVLLTGIDPSPMAAAMLSLLFELPDAVAVRHHIDVESGTLTRVVSDLGGILDEATIDLDHACVTCAIREDVLPTLERLASTGKWRSIVAHLPVGAEAVHLCRALAADPARSRKLRVATVAAAFDGPSVLSDLLGDDLLAERNMHSSDDDRRGVGEVGCAMAEYADLVMVVGEPFSPGLDLLSALARPGVDIATETSRITAAALTVETHRMARRTAWTTPTRPMAAPLATWSHAWRLELTAPMPFHPDRLMENLVDLGGGVHRSRGCFWLPTRPDRVMHWSGAGGQLSFGDVAAWSDGIPHTTLLLTGVGELAAPLAEVFRRTLLTPDEAASHNWQVASDGFEPWLGPIRHVA